MHSRRQIAAGFLAAVAVYGVLLVYSLGSALLNPAFGSSTSARVTEWVRENGGASLANWVEREWYTHHQPPVGGKPPAGALKVSHTRTSVSSASSAPHLAAPSNLEPFASPWILGEGQWAPVGRLVHGLPAVYETKMRPDAIHTRQVVGLAWMDTKLLRATLYSGSQIPGGGPYANTAPVSPSAATSLVSAFNAGFLLSDANGGYYTDGKLIAPLRTGAASFVIYRDGTVALGQWGRDVSMTSSVASVRQNLDLLVDGGAPVPGLNSTDSSKWGATLGGGVYVWRSGIGVTANGALVYVGGPSMNITDLANLLVRAGAVRAMELDINTDWVNFAAYSPGTPTGPATLANGTDLLPQMVGSPGRYFASYWARDFFTMSAR